jgi:predicted flap endonuclease-1-like 5' DNA nuclease
LTDDISELRSAEGQHEADMTRLEKEFEKELDRDRQARLVLEQELEEAREMGRKADSLDTALVNLQSESDSRAALAGRELADIQSRLDDKTNDLSLLEKRNAGLEEQLTRSRQAQLKLATGYNEGMDARKQLQALQKQGAGLVEDHSQISRLEERIDLQIQYQRSLEVQVRNLESERALQQKSLEILGQQLEDARESEVRLVQRHRELEEIVEKHEHTPLPEEPAVLYEMLPDRVDNLKQIKGLGVAAERQLNSLGIYHFQQIAAFDEGNVDWVEIQLKKLKGRFQRDDWIAQATHLLKAQPPAQDSELAFH